MTPKPPPSRSLKDRLTKVPDWFRPKNQMEEAYAKDVLHGFQKLDQADKRRADVARASALPKAAELIRNYDVRAKSFLGGKTFPWASDSWERVQISRFRKDHPLRYLVWRISGRRILTPAF